MPYLSAYRGLPCFAYPRITRAHLFAYGAHCNAFCPHTVSVYFVHIVRFSYILVLIFADSLCIIPSCIYALRMIIYRHKEEQNNPPKERTKAMYNTKRYLIEIDYITEREFESFDTLAEAQEFMEENYGLDMKMYKMW